MNQPTHSTGGLAGFGLILMIFALMIGPALV